MSASSRRSARMPSGSRLSRIVTAVALLAVVTLPLHASGAQPPVASTSSAPPARSGLVTGAAFDIQLRPGDVVKITSWRNPELSGEIPVSPDGLLQHPLYPGVRAADVPFGTVVEQVRTVLARYDVEPQFTAEPLFR